MSARKIGPLLLTVFSVILGLIWLAPLFWLVTTALTETTFNMSFLPNSPFTFQNINYVWHAVPFGQYYMNTLILVIVTFCIQFVTSTMAAYSLAFLDYRGKSLVFVIIFMQIIIPNVVLIIPNYLMGAFNIFLVRNYYENAIPTALIESAQAFTAADSPEFEHALKHHFRFQLADIIIIETPSQIVITDRQIFIRHRRDRLLTQLLKD